MHLTISLKQLIYFCILIFVVHGNSPKKIYGGEIVSVYKYPHQVSIQYRNYHVCGGVIISQYHILTSASCVLAERNVVYGNIEILSGTNDLEKEGDIIYWKIYQVAYVIIHDRYKPHKNWINDIAILKLSSSIEFSDERKEAEVLSQKTTNHYSFHITGWGVDPTTGIMSRFLQIIYIQSLSPGRCMKEYYEKDTLSEFQHCCIPRKPAAKITSGNGGSPVMVGRKIVGIVSFVPVDSRLPAVYIRACKYGTWIEAMKKKI